MSTNTDKLNVTDVGEVVITKEDVARIIRSIAYRTAYNNRPDVRANRKEYNRRRNERMRKVREYIKQHPEVMA